MAELRSQQELQEMARLGDEAFDRWVRPTLRPEDNGKFYAVDVISGDFELDEDDYMAVSRLNSRQPASRIWLGRVGEPAAHRIRGVR